MYINKLFDELKQGDEVVVRYARGSKYAKGKVTKITKTQITTELIREDGVSETARFNKSNGDEVGGKRCIARDYARWDDETGQRITERLMTYADADNLIEARKIEEAVNAAKRDERQLAAEAEFASVIEKTYNDRQSLTLIDTYENTETYKVVVNSWQNQRVLGILKVFPEQHYNFGAGKYIDGFGFTLAVSSDNRGWGSSGTEHAETLDKVIDQVMYRLYKTW